MRRKREKGQAMVEFALILPILMLLICGIIDFGWLFANQIIANNATREAARYTAIHYSESSPDEATPIARSIIEGKAENINIVTVSAIKLDDQITISFQGTIPVLTPFTSIFIGDPYTVKAKSVMRLE